MIVNLREGSSTFLQWFRAELSAVNKKMLYIPEGFANGFQCLTDDCELLYHHTEFYTPQAEAELRYNDPMLNIVWPLQVSQVPARDRSHAYISENFKGI